MAKTRARRRATPPPAAITILQRSMVHRVSDLAGAEIVRIEGRPTPLRITYAKDERDGTRWALVLRDDLSETSDHEWLEPGERVLEVLRDQGHYAGAMPGKDADPMKS